MLLNLVKEEFKNRGIKYRVTDQLMATFFSHFIKHIESGGLTQERTPKDPLLKQFKQQQPKSVRDPRLAQFDQ